MSTPKYKQMFDEMLTSNKSLFDEYNQMLELYDSDNKKYADQMSELQRKVLRIIKNTENALCSRSETTGHANYSTNLADKYWQEVRAVFPRVEDYIETA